MALFALTTLSIITLMAGLWLPLMHIFTNSYSPLLLRQLLLIGSSSLAKQVMALISPDYVPMSSKHTEWSQVTSVLTNFSSGTQRWFSERLADSIQNRHRHLIITSLMTISPNSLTWSKSTTYLGNRSIIWTRKDASMKGASGLYCTSSLSCEQFRQNTGQKVQILSLLLLSNVSVQMEQSFLLDLSSLGKNPVQNGLKLIQISGENFASHDVKFTSLILPHSIRMSPNGWTDDFLCTKWFRKCFILQATMRKVSNMLILLLYDGHGSHNTIELIELVCEHNIILFCLPPHTTHKLQPLDVNVFGPFTHA